MAKSSAFSRLIALRYLWSKRSEAFITIITVISILGVAIGVMVLNIVMAIMTGFESELRDKIVGANSHILVKRVGGRIEGWHAARDKILEVPGVSSVSAFTYHQALLRTQNGSSGLLIRGVERDSSSAKQLASYLYDGQSVDQLFDPPKVLLAEGEEDQREAALPGLFVGRELARNDGLFRGMALQIISPQVGSTPFGLVPRMKRFVVAGTYASGLVEYESGLAYASLSEAQKFFRMGDAVSGLEVRVNEVDKAPQVAKQIVDALGGLSSGFFAQDWTETNKPLWDAIGLEKKVYFLVLLLIIVMASFSIITTLIMIVLEKRKDIAILKTMGASTAAVANIFRLQGAVIGLLGTMLGLIGGYCGCVGLKHYGFPLDNRIFPMSTLPVHIELVNFALVGVAAFAICYLATIYPARRAASLHPSEVLRYE